MSSDDRRPDSVGEDPSAARARPPRPPSSPRGAPKRPGGGRADLGGDLSQQKPSAQDTGSVAIVTADLPIPTATSTASASAPETVSIDTPPPPIEPGVTAKRRPQKPARPNHNRRMIAGSIAGSDHASGNGSGNGSSSRSSDDQSTNGDGHTGRSVIDPGMVSAPLAPAEPTPAAPPAPLDQLDDIPQPVRSDLISSGASTVDGPPEPALAQPAAAEAEQPPVASRRKQTFGSFLQRLKEPFDTGQRRPASEPAHDDVIIDEPDDHTVGLPETTRPNVGGNPPLPAIVPQRPTVPLRVPGPLTAAPPTRRSAVAFAPAPSPSPSIPAAVPAPTRMVPMVPMVPTPGMAAMPPDFDDDLDLDLDQAPTAAAAKRIVRSTAAVGRRRPRIRRVTRVVRHVDPWSVFKVAVCFSVVLYGVCLTAGVLLWNVAYTTGTIDNMERFFESFGWDTFEFKGGELFHSAWIGGLFAAVGLTGLIVLAVTLFNLITDLVGGVRVTVLEEEVIERDPMARRSVFRGSRVPGRPMGDPYDPDAPIVDEYGADPDEAMPFGSEVADPVRIESTRDLPNHG